MVRNMRIMTLCHLAKQAEIRPICTGESTRTTTTSSILPGFRSSMDKFSMTETTTPNEVASTAASTSQTNNKPSSILPGFRSFVLLIHCWTAMSNNNERLSEGLHIEQNDLIHSRSLKDELNHVHWDNHKRLAEGLSIDRKDLIHCRSPKDDLNHVHLGNH